MFSVLFVLIMGLPALAQEKRATRESFACSNLDQLMLAGEMVVKKDYASFKAYITDMANIGECVMINKGNRLFVESVTGGVAACVRVRAEKKCRWTVPQSYE